MLINIMCFEHMRIEMRRSINKVNDSVSRRPRQSYVLSLINVSYW